MKSFSQLSEELEDTLDEILKSSGVNSAEVFDDHITAIIDDKATVQNVVDALPENAEFDIFVYENEDGDVVDESDEDDEEPEIAFEELDDDTHTFELVVYTFNTDLGESLTEVKRIKKVNAKGKVRIKLKCKKGFKYDRVKNKCSKIQAKELRTKKKAIRKSVRTKKAKGGGARRRSKVLRAKAMRKRKSLGL